MRTGTNRKRTPATPTAPEFTADGTELTVDWTANGDSSVLSCTLINTVSGWVETGSAIDAAETHTFATAGIAGQTYCAKLVAFLSGEASKGITSGSVTV
jgi:hypothetical protein